MLQTWIEMNPEEVARLDFRDGDWTPKAWKWRATHKVEATNPIILS